MQQTTSIQVQGVLQVDLLDIRIRGSSHTDHVEGVSVQVERMTQVGLLDLVHEDDFHDGVQGDVHSVGAHAVLCAIRWSVVSIAELLRGYVFDLREKWGGRGNVRDLVNERYQKVSTSSDWKGLKDVSKILMDFRTFKITYPRIGYTYWERISLQGDRRRTGKARRSSHPVSQLGHPCRS